MRQDEVFIPIIMFLSTAAVFIAWILTRHKERISMIEKGLSSEEIKAMYHRDARQNARRDPLGSLKWGLLFVLAGLAIMAGNFLHMVYNVDEGVIVGLISLFVGIGLLIFYSIAVRQPHEQKP